MANEYVFDSERFRENPALKSQAHSGLGPIVDKDWSPALKTRKGWETYANRKVAEMNKNSKLKWTAVVSWIGNSGYYRIAYASQPYNFFTGKDC